MVLFTILLCSLYPHFLIIYFHTSVLLLTLFIPSVSTAFSLVHQLKPSSLLKDTSDADFGRK